MSDHCTLQELRFARLASYPVSTVTVVLLWTARTRIRLYLFGEYVLLQLWTSCGRQQWLCCVHSCCTVSHRSRRSAFRTWTRTLLSVSFQSASCATCSNLSSSRVIWRSALTGRVASRASTRWGSANRVATETCSIQTQVAAVFACLLLSYVLGKCM